jgi:hypothetical protein
MRPADDRFSVAPEWHGRAFALARVLMFAVAFVAASYGVNPALAGLQKHIATLGGHGVATLVLIALMAAVSGRPFRSYG